MPSPNAANPAFLAGAPGDYVFSLKAWDVEGNPSCAEAVLVVNATQLQRATFELTWQSVGPIVDPKPPCMGQDVDLHFVHPNATGILMDYYGTCPLPGYFDLWWDCFWYNKSPSWGIAPDPNVQDETRMIADAQAAPGPEIVDQGLVCQKNSYKVGVHLFDDCGYGPVIAKVRIYVVGTMVHEQSVQLSPLDLWEVGRFNCETGMFVPTPGGPTVTKGCLNPNFQTPK